MPILADQLETHHKSIIEFIKTNCSNLSVDCRIGNDDGIPTEVDDNDGELLYVNEFQKGFASPTYCYDSHFWHVPKNFSFQKNPTRKVGWEYWIKGKPNNEVLVNNILKKAPVRPYRKLQPKLIPCVKQRNVLTSTWTPIFKIMGNARFKYSG